MPRAAPARPRQRVALFGGTSTAHHWARPRRRARRTTRSRCRAWLIVGVVAAGRAKGGARGCCGWATESGLCKRILCEWTTRRTTGRTTGRTAGRTAGGTTAEWLFREWRLGSRLSGERFSKRPGLGGALGRRRRGDFRRSRSVHHENLADMLDRLGAGPQADRDEQGLPLGALGIGPDLDELMAR